MIEVLNNLDENTANSILEVQIPAYQVEAKIIEFDGIPALKDTIETIKTTKETFIGYKIEKELVGFLSYSKSNDEFQICRLVVHPNYFRRGIAKKIINYFIAQIVKNSKVIVSTGKKNLPAITLYKSFNFRIVKDIEVAPMIFITYLEKNGMMD